MEGKSPRSLFAGVFHKFWWCALLKNLYARGRKIKWRREYFPFRIETSRYFYYSALMKIYILLRQNRTARCYSRPTLEIFLGDFNSPWFVSRSFHRSPSLLRPQPPIDPVRLRVPSPFPPQRGDNMPNAYSISKIHSIPRERKLLWATRAPT